MSECPSCGASVPSGSPTCTECGARVEGATESFEPVGTADLPPGVEAPSDEGPVLVVRKGAEVGERFYLDRDRLTVGRDPRSDIFLNDITVSRHHAVLSNVAGEIEIVDSGSLNGTYVNTICVDKALLASGDVVQIGMFQMVFLAGKGG